MTIPIIHASASRVRAALEGQHGVSEAQLSGIVGSLLDAGLCTADLTSSDRIAASHNGTANALENEARRTAARLNLPISASGRIDPDDLTRALNNQSYGIEARLRMRTMFHACGFIPA